MKYPLKKLTLSIFLLASVIAYSQQVKDFSLPNAADGNIVSLNQFKQYEWIVLVFAGNECAYMDYYRERLNLLSTSYRQTVPFLFVNAHPGPSEGMAAMRSKYSQWGLSVPYLSDKEQTIMNQLGAQKSPEVFLMKNGNGFYTVVYRGAIDDNPLVAGDVSRSYLKEGIDAIIAGKKPSVAKTRPVGCTIRKK